MMTKAATIMMVILAMFAVALPAGAFGGKGHEKDKGKHHGHEGTVTAVNTAKKTITLEEHLKEKTHTATYPVDDDAKIKVNGKDAKLGDVKAGMHASIELEKDKDVKNINAHTPKDKDKDKDKNEGKGKGKGKSG